MSVPASTSNLGPGFDVLGLALELRNEIHIEALSREMPPASAARMPWIVEITGEGLGALPQDAGNMVVQVLKSHLPRPLRHRSLRLRMRNRIPIARGLGSSAAARLGGLLAARALNSNGYEIDARDILGRACRLEGHPDNAVAAYHGGLCAALAEGEAIRHFRIRVPKELSAVVCIPEFELSTERAREILPAHVARSDAVSNAAHLLFLLEAIERKRFDWLRLAMQDRLHQPYRRKLIPGMEAVIEAALQAGSFGAALSGSGPSIFAWAPAGRRASAIALAMQKAFGRFGIRSRALTPAVARTGARVETHP